MMQTTSDQASPMASKPAVSGITAEAGRVSEASTKPSSPDSVQRFTGQQMFQGDPGLGIGRHAL